MSVSPEVVSTQVRQAWPVLLGFALLCQSLWEHKRAESERFSKGDMEEHTRLLRPDRKWKIREIDYICISMRQLQCSAMCLCLSLTVGVGKCP